MAYIGFHSIVFIMLTLSALKWVNGAPAATPSPCHLCESKVCHITFAQQSLPTGLSLYRYGKILLTVEIMQSSSQ